jgi:CheY-like chemotaxis protein
MAVIRPSGSPSTLSMVPTLVPSDAKTAKPIRGFSWGSIRLSEGGGVGGGDWAASGNIGTAARITINPHDRRRRGISINASSHRCLIDNGKGGGTVPLKVGKRTGGTLFVGAALNHWLWGVTSEGLPVFASNNAAVPRSSAAYPALVGKRILVVDDEAATCVDYLFQLRERGAKAEAVVSTNAAALSFLESHPIDAAILDYRLSDGTSKPLMEWLREHQIPFVIISGWVEMLPNEAGAAPILEKPLLHDELCQALSDLLH